MEDTVSLVSETESIQPVQICKDTGGFQSLILQDVLPFSEKSALDSSALVKGFGKGFVNVPLHHVNRKTDLVSGVVGCVLPYTRCGFHSRESNGYSKSDFRPTGL